MKNCILSQLRKTLKADMTMHTWEYKTIRFDYLGRGITQEFNLLDMDGKRVEGWWFSDTKVKTLPDLLQLLGAAGWEAVSYTVNQDVQKNNVTLHYMLFKRPGKIDVDYAADETLTEAKQPERTGRKLVAVP